LLFLLNRDLAAAAAAAEQPQFQSQETESKKVYGDMK
jgi:hypothetical protein